MKPESKRPKQQLDLFATGYMPAWGPKVQRLPRTPRPSAISEEDELNDPVDDLWQGVAR
jgi:hypothetical protein